MIDLLHTFVPHYNPPDRRTIADSILTECYENLQTKVNTRLAKEQHINVVFDETSNVRNQRILNISFNTKSGSYYYRSDDMKDKTLDATTTANWVFSKLQEFLSPELDWSRINSFATDTCNTMKAVWRVLSAKPELQHAFFIPCDSHGIQLVIKDILQLPSIQHTFTSAANIVTHFRNSPKQYAILRSKQTEIYDQTYSLTASVLTRWGSQYTMLMSVKRIQEALRSWANETAKTTITKIVLDFKFWGLLDELIALLKPLHEIQKMSESQKADIMKVSFLLNRFII
jgi:hypothetical protein